MGDFVAVMREGLKYNGLQAIVNVALKRCEY